VGDDTTRGTKVLKVRYYLTVIAEAELEIPEGMNEDEVVRSALSDLPANRFNVLTADVAEVEDEEQVKRCIPLT
jgi:hypothetical protein